MKNSKKLLLAALVGTTALTGLQAQDTQQDKVDAQIGQLEEAFKEAATELEENNAVAGGHTGDNVDTNENTQLPEEQEVAENTPKADTEETLPEDLGPVAEQIEQNSADKVEDKSTEPAMS